MRAFFLAFFMAFAVLPPAVQAHAVVVRSSLDQQTPTPGKAAEVHLFFNSDVEPLLSIVYLVSAEDRNQPLELRHGPKPGELVVALPPLTPGEYALQFKVFAADGHITEDILKFNVAGE